MNRNTALLMAMALLIASLGCAHDNHSEEHMGESYRALKAQMIANPEAGDEVKPVDGIGATTADEVTGNYHARQQEQPHDDQPTSLLDLVEGR
jgi:hypothetical protein